MKNNDKSIKSIENQKVTNIMVMVTLENGKALISRPTELGNIDGLHTLMECQRSMSNNNEDVDEEYRFKSPVVWVEDLKQCAEEWIKYFENGEDVKEFNKDDERARVILIGWINQFFCLKDRSLMNED